MPNIYRQKYRNKRKKLALNYLGNRCSLCGSTKKLEFDHINPDTKKFNILDTVSLDKSMDTFMVELDKCQLLCKSCHLIKTAVERQFNVPRHGTFGWATNHSCYCDDCVKVKREYRLQYQREYRKRKKLNKE